MTVLSPSMKVRTIHSSGVRLIWAAARSCMDFIRKITSRSGIFFSMRFHSSRRREPSIISSSVEMERPMSSSGKTTPGWNSNSPSVQRSSSKTASWICSCTKSSSLSLLRYSSLISSWPSLWPRAVVLCSSRASSTCALVTMPACSSLTPSGFLFQLVVAKKTSPLRKQT